jgi:hypothetical protein
MRKVLVIQLLLASILYLNGQTPVGSWSDHLVYNTARCVAVGSAEVYASTGSSIIVFNREYSELKKMSRTNGLTGTEISTLGWSGETKTLIIAYTTTNLDLVLNNSIYNIPDIFRKYIPGRKVINRIRANGKYAYLACSFGIVVVDLIKKEIYDTWKPGTETGNNEVSDVTFMNNLIYAATSNGVYSANLNSQGLAYFANWDRILSLPAGRFTSVVSSGNKIIVNRSGSGEGGDSVYSVDDASSLLSFVQGVYNTSLDPAPNGFTISSPSLLRYYSSDGTLLKTITSYDWGTPDISQGVCDNTDFWIADMRSGLVRIVNKSRAEQLTLQGPVSNNAFSIASLNGKTVICGGATDVSWNNIWRMLEISVHENNSWSSFTPGTIRDALRALIDPGNSNHLFVSTWGAGLLEYENGNLKKQYTESNSPLQNIIPGNPYVRICGLAMDDEKNLWITQTGVTGSIKVLKPDGTWIANPLTIDAPTIGDIIITRSGQKWIILPRGYGLFVFDDNKTPSLFSDDRSRKLLVKDNENTVIPTVYSLAEDLDGSIWVGTDQGPLVYFNPEKVFDTDLNASRIKIARNDGSGLADYILGTEIITSVAIDGANRKWLGTYSSGAYLLSADGTVKIKNFNVQNSPILSNTIVSMAVDNKTGDVWFGTSSGLISIRGDATKGGEEFSHIYAFPNPVREDFNGKVTITGLMRDSHVTITDISGNLVNQTVSDGGQASWDLSTYNGRRVSTGVYLIFCASSDGRRSAVTKILVIH